MNNKLELVLKMSSSNVEISWSALIGGEQLEISQGDRASSYFFLFFLLRASIQPNRLSWAESKLSLDLAIYSVHLVLVFKSGFEQILIEHVIYD